MAAVAVATEAVAAATAAGRAAAVAAHLAAAALRAAVALEARVATVGALGWATVAVVVLKEERRVAEGEAVEVEAEVERAPDPWATAEAAGKAPAVPVCLACPAGVREGAGARERAAQVGGEREAAARVLALEAMVVVVVRAPADLVARTF